MSENRAIWEKVCQTDPKYTKGFNRSGGFKGTATNATYLAMRATEVFGPIGTGWGIEKLEEQYVNGAPILDTNGNAIAHEVIHVVYVRLWYNHGDKQGEVHQYGQTQFVGKNKYGTFTDEEAPKKSLTDAMTKCLSLLGFAADIHLGLYDDNKYVSEVRQHFAEAEAAEKRQKAQKPTAKENDLHTKKPDRPTWLRTWMTVNLGVPPEDTNTQNQLVYHCTSRKYANVEDACQSKEATEAFVKAARDMVENYKSGGVSLERAKADLIKAAQAETSTADLFGN